MGIFFSTTRAWNDRNSASEETLKAMWANTGLANNAISCDSSSGRLLKRRSRRADGQDRSRRRFPCQERPYRIPPTPPGLRRVVQRGGYQCCDSQVPNRGLLVG